MTAPAAGVPTVHIRGLAERAASLGPDVTVPETLPVLVEFSRDQPAIGTAALTRDDEGIRADATLWLTGLFAEMARSEDRRLGLRAGQSLRKLWPKFALGIARTVVAKDDDGTDVITSGEVVALSLCRENVDPDLPPWEVVRDA